MKSGFLWTPEEETFDSYRPAKVRLLGEEVEKRLWNREGVWHGIQGANPWCVAYVWLHWWASWEGSREPIIEPRDLYARIRRSAGRSLARTPGATVSEGRDVILAEGWARTYARLVDTEEIHHALIASGPVIIGSEWTTGMHQDRMSAAGRPLGAHAYLLDGYDRGMVRVKNSLTKREQRLPLQVLGSLKWEAWIALP